MSMLQAHRAGMLHSSCSRRTHAGFEAAFSMGLDTHNPAMHAQRAQARLFPANDKAWVCQSKECHPFPWVLDLGCAHACGVLGLVPAALSPGHLGLQGLDFRVAKPRLDRMGSDSATFSAKVREAS